MARAVLFPVSDERGHMNGEAVSLSGGMSASNVA